MNEEQQLEQISDVQEKNSGLEQTQAQGTKEERTYSKEEVTDIVEKRLRREREKMEKQFSERINALEENIKLQAMSEQEKANYQAQKERDAFEQERQAFYQERDAFNKDRYRSTIEQQLQAKGLPTDLADLLTDYDAETVASKIASMEKSFTTQVNNSIQDRVKASANTPTVPQEEAKPLTLEDINAMTPTQFKQNKAEIEKVLMEAFKK